MWQILSLQSAETSQISTQPAEGLSVNVTNRNCLRKVLGHGKSLEQLLQVCVTLLEELSSILREDTAHREVYHGGATVHNTRHYEDKCTSDSSCGPGLQRCGKNDVVRWVILDREFEQVGEWRPTREHYRPEWWTPTVWGSSGCVVLYFLAWFGSTYALRGKAHCNKIKVIMSEQLYPVMSGLFQVEKLVCHPSSGAPQTCKNLCQGALKLFWWLVVAKHLNKFNIMLFFSFNLSSVCMHWQQTKKAA